MSIFSDYECGALSDREFRDECYRMNRQERDELNQIRAYIDRVTDRDKVCPYTDEPCERFGCYDCEVEE